MKSLLAAVACCFFLTAVGCGHNSKSADVQFSQNIAHPPPVSADAEAKSDQQRLDWFKKHHPDMFDANGKFKRGPAITASTGH